MQRIWLSGYRTYELNIFNDKDPKITVLKEAIKRKIIDSVETYDEVWIISGGNLGIEQYGLEVANELRKTYSNLKTSLILPYQNFSGRWKEESQAKLSAIQAQVDYFGLTSQLPYQSPVQLHNFQDFMLKHTDESFFIYDLEHPGKPEYDYNSAKKFSEQHEYTVNLVDFYDLEEIARTLNEKD